MERNAVIFNRSESLSVSIGRPMVDPFQNLAHDLFSDFNTDHKCDRIATELHGEDAGMAVTGQPLSSSAVPIDKRDMTI